MKLKAHKTKESQTTLGTVLAAQMRAQCNGLTHSEREKLEEQFMKLYHGGKSRRPSAHRR